MGYSDVIYYCHVCGSELYDDEVVLCSMCIEEDEPIGPLRPKEDEFDEEGNWD